MSDNPCRTRELELALSQVRLSWERYVLTRARFERIVAHIKALGEKSPYDTVARAGELIELAGQVIDALDGGRPKVGGLLAAFGKSLSMWGEDQAEDEKVSKERTRLLGDLLLVLKELEHDMRQFIHDREVARPLFEAYWACTEKLRPRRFELAIVVEGSSSGLATARFKRVYKARPAVKPHEPKGTYEARIRRWLDDPTLTEIYVGEGPIAATMPTYAWTSNRPDVQVLEAKRGFTGGPLRGRATVWWQRGNPSVLSAAFIATGEQTLHLAVTLRVQGHTNVIGGEQPVHDLLKGSLTLHRIGKKLVRIPRVDDHWHLADTKGGSTCTLTVRPAR